MNRTLDELITKYEIIINEFEQEDNEGFGLSEEQEFERDIYKQFLIELNDLKQYYLQET